MTNEEKILNIVNENNGYITNEDLKKNNINHIFLSRLVEKGELKKISKSYYGLHDYIPDEYFITLSKSRNAVYSHNTALYFHDLSDQTPLKLDITVSSNYSGILQKNDNVTLHTVNENIISLGVMEKRSPFGMMIKVYNIERTICDIIKEKNKIDAEIFSVALKRYIARKDKNLNKLNKYAKKLKIEEKVRGYMEVLL